MDITKIRVLTSGRRRSTKGVMEIEHNSRARLSHGHNIMQELRFRDSIYDSTEGIPIVLAVQIGDFGASRP